ncbi:MAG: ubiquitin activation protein, partial [Proteobacteria bacterium]
MRLPRLQDLSPWIATKLRAPKELTWRVELLDPRDPAHRGRIRWLSLRPDYRVTDTLAMQLDDLVATTHPGARLQGHALERALAEARGGRPLEECGTYVHYPWKKELVRVLDRDDFVRLRTNRNWYKITPEEQSALGRKTVAIAGLSVGLAVVTTLALERVGGRFHLADFDELALTNLNRLLAGVSEIGLPKTVIAARRLLELDPYLEITLFSEGVTRDNVGTFLEGVDLLVEECDGLDALEERAH